MTKDFIHFIRKKEYKFNSVGFMSDVGMAARWHEFITTDWRGEYSNVIETEENNEEDSTIITKYENIEILKSYGLKLLENNMKVCFIMRGPSGSGKSTLCRELKQLHGDKCNVFSTDAYFGSSGQYRFNPDKLHEYHEMNYKEFCNSDDVLMCVDNTNLHINEYARYVQNAKNRGYITIILSFPVLELDTYINRSKHINNMSVIKKQIKKYKKSSASPIYYGIFVNHLKNNEEFCELFNPAQNTPLHITCSLFNRKECIDMSPEYGRICHFKIIAMNYNKAGRCLIIELDEESKHLFKFEATIPHITLETYEKFKPVNVGENIPYGQNVKYDLEYYGVYGPIY